jgi:hypothetical protein
MNAKKALLLAVSLALVAVAVALVRPDWAPVAQALPGACSANDLRGTYSFVIHGNNPAAEPFGAIGTFTSDGAGNLDGFRVSLDNGEYSTADFTCTYSMSAGCTFRGPCVDDGEAVAEVQIDGAMADANREVQLLVSGIPDAPGSAVVTGSARKW